MFGNARYRIQVRQGDSGSWYWRVVAAANGHIVLTSETYASKGNAVKAARKFQADLLNDWWVEVKVAE